MTSAHTHSAAGASRSRLVAVLMITSVVLIAEIIGGLLSGSLALLADAAHMFTDVAGISMALFAIWLGKRPAGDERTFGSYRVEILAAVLNALLLFGVAGSVLFEAWRRLDEPPSVATGSMLAVAVLGLLANAVSLWLLRHAQALSLNMRGAYLEVLGDLLGSAAVIVAAITIMVTGFQQADAIASALIGVMILPRTWRLLREAVDVLLEAAPRGVDLAEIRQHIVGTEGVEDVHDLHVWTITSGMLVLSAHVVIDEAAEPAGVLDRLCECLTGHFDLEHSTFQLETEDRKRLEERRHP